jgi:tetratricopeptide (TPR) repeat protein/glycosyltransferase involved in cell wall biosynthesis
MKTSIVTGVLRALSRLSPRGFGSSIASSDGRSDAAELIAIADRLRDERRWSEASAHYARALRSVPRLAGIWVQRGHCEKEAGDTAGALAAYDRGAALTGDPASADALLHRGHLLQRLGQVVRAEKSFGEIIERAARGPVAEDLVTDASLALGALAANAKRWSAARDHYARVLDIAPERHDVWVQLGHAHKEDGDVVRAEYCYRAAIALDDSVADHWLQLGHILKLRNRREDAARAYARAVLLEGDREDALVALRAASGHSPVEVLARLAEGADAAEQYRVDQTRHSTLRQRAMHSRHTNDDVLGGVTILFFANIDWHYRRQRAQHIALRLADRGARVIYVSTVFDSTTDDASFRLIDEPHPGVFEARLAARRSGGGALHDRIDAATFEALRRSVRDLVGNLALVDYSVVVQHPAWAPVLRELSRAAIIFDCLDDTQAFKEADPALAAYETELIEAADHVICTSRSLSERIEGVDVSLVRNGVDSEAFSRSAPRAPIRSPRTVLGYFGAIADWFDVDLLAHLARRRPDWDFVLCGEVTTDAGALAALRNVTLVGELPYADLPARLASFDVALIPFKISPLTRATNPVKLYEYLAGGKPVVATPMPELLELGDLVAIASDVDELEKAVVDVVAGDDSSRIERRIAWAREQDWEKRVDNFVPLILRRHPPRTVTVDSDRLGSAVREEIR